MPALGGPELTTSSYGDSPLVNIPTCILCAASLEVAVDAVRRDRVGRAGVERTGWCDRVHDAAGHAVFHSVRWVERGALRTASGIGPCSGGPCVSASSPLAFIAWASRGTAPQPSFVVQALNSTANLARAFFRHGRQLRPTLR